MSPRPPIVLPDRAPTLVADGLALRPWEPSDASFVLDLARDPETQRWAQSFWSVTDLETAAAWIEARLEFRTMWVVCAADSGAPAGWIGLSYLEPDEWSMMISYGTAPDLRRQGVSGRAVRAVTEYGFGELGLARISLEHAVGNLGSCAVAASAGYAVEGTLRQRIRQADGGLDDSHAHARLFDDPGEPLPSVGFEPVEIAAGKFQLCIANAAIDAAAVIEACADPEIKIYNTGPVDLAGAERWCSRAADWSAGTYAGWVVKDTLGTLLGRVGLFDIDRDQGSAQIGYWVAAGSRRQGVASAAVDSAARFGFSELGLHRIELFHAVENEASCRTAKRAGFGFEADLRKSYGYGDGVFRDEHLHARLASD